MTASIIAFWQKTTCVSILAVALAANATDKEAHHGNEQRQNRTQWRSIRRDD